MIFLVYGENDFLISERIKWFKQSISQNKDYPEIKNINFLEENWDFFLENLKSQSIFPTKKLIFIENLSNSKFEQNFKLFLKNSYDKVNKDRYLWLVFIEKNSKNKIINSLIRKGIKKYETLPFSFKNRQGFIKYFNNYLNKFRISIETRALILLGDFFNYNGWLVKNELKKLISIIKNNNITSKDIEKYCLPKYLENEVFQLSEKIFQANKKESILILKKMFYWGEDEGKIFNILLNQIKNFIKIKYLPPSELKFKDFYIKKAKILTNKISTEKLKLLYKYIANIDLKIKTSRLTYREALLDLFRRI